MRKEYRPNGESVFIYPDLLDRYFGRDLQLRAFYRISDLAETLRQFAAAWCDDSRGGVFSVLWEIAHLIYNDLYELCKEKIVEGEETP